MVSRSGVLYSSNPMPDPVTPVTFAIEHVVAL